MFKYLPMCSHRLDATAASRSFWEASFTKAIPRELPVSRSVKRFTEFTVQISEKNAWMSSFEAWYARPVTLISNSWLGLAGGVATGAAAFKGAAFTGAFFTGSSEDSSSEDDSTLETLSFHGFCNTIFLDGTANFGILKFFLD